MQSLAEIRQRHNRGHRWRCAQDIGDLLGLLDEAVELLDAMTDDEACRLDYHGNCQTHHLGNPCEIAQAREFVERLRGEAL